MESSDENAGKQPPATQVTSPERDSTREPSANVPDRDLTGHEGTNPFARRGLLRTPPAQRSSSAPSAARKTMIDLTKTYAALPQKKTLQAIKSVINGRRHRPPRQLPKKQRKADQKKVKLVPKSTLERSLTKKKKHSRS